VGGQGPWSPAAALIDLALAEDIGSGDVTTLATVAADRRAHGTLLAKSPGVISGLEVAAAVFHRVDPAVVFTPLVADGARVGERQPIATVVGAARSLLVGERTALNLLQRLSGVATLTAAFVAAVEGTRGAYRRYTQDDARGCGRSKRLPSATAAAGTTASVCPTVSSSRTTTSPPSAELGGPAPRSDFARETASHGLKIEVEVTNLAELEEALEAGADIILLDNMTVEDVAEAVRLTGERALLEASGGITLETVRAIAETGVDLISVGALTHSAPALDISLDFALDANSD
jgi:nicotinate-nucleotide pyrophosphorylase (carboxylating)